MQEQGSTAVALAMVTPGYEQDPASGVADYATHQDQAQFEADKRSVYKHPLFPLLALLFERCEQATQSSDNSTYESFNMDIQAFVQHQERDRKPFLINDPEIDGLMIKAIQVLRIHLLELEKVQELCKDFCNRYITCLKGKMQSENLLRSDYSHHGHDVAPSSGGSNGSSPLQVVSSTGNDVEPGVNGLGVSQGGSDHHHHHLDYYNEHRHGIRMDSSNDNDDDPLRLVDDTDDLNIDNNGGSGDHRAIDDMPPDDDDDDDEPPHSPGSSVMLHHGGSTSFGQIAAASHHSQDIDQNNGSPSSTLSDEDEEGSSAGASSGNRQATSKSSKGRQKRGVLPKQATGIMRAWLFQHLVHPYPTEDEKRQIASQTNLTLLQVNNWFINARRRILQPMLDGAAGAAIADLPQAPKRLKSSKHQVLVQSKKQQHHHQLTLQQSPQQQQEQQQQPMWQSDDESESDSASEEGDSSNAIVERSSTRAIDDEEELH